MLYLLPHYVKEGQELPDGGVWLHGRAAPQRDDGRRDEQAAEEGRIPGEGAASGYGEVRATAGLAELAG